MPRPIILRIEITEADRQNFAAAYGNPASRERLRRALADAIDFEVSQWADDSRLSRSNGNLTSTTEIACQCGETIKMREGHTYDKRIRFVTTHSDPAYFGLDYDPKPIHTPIGSQIKDNGQIVHDCVPSAAFL